MRLPLLLALLLAACGEPAANSDAGNREVPASVDPSLVACSTDEDCVQAAAGCCGCAEGGRATSVNRASQDEWEVHRKTGCPLDCCDEVPSTDTSCAARPVCESGACVLR